jgi:hypothetical protein
MANKKKAGLQKVTDTEKMSLKILKEKFNNGDNISSEDCDALSFSDRKKVNSYLEKISEKLIKNMDTPEGVSAFDKFWIQVSDTVTVGTRNHVYESNHNRILNQIHQYVKIYWQVPSITKISEETGLSRTTIYRHLDETNLNDYVGKEFIKFNMLIPKIIGSLYALIFDGNTSVKDIIKASKTILEFQEFSNKYGGGVNIEQQNNQININNTILTQEQVQNLPPDVMAQIEKLIIST